MDKPPGRIIGYKVSAMCEENMVRTFTKYCKRRHIRAVHIFTHFVHGLICVKI